MERDQKLAIDIIEILIRHIINVQNDKEKPKVKAEPVKVVVKEEVKQKASPLSPKSSSKAKKVVSSSSKVNKVTLPKTWGKVGAVKF